MVQPRSHLDQARDLLAEVDKHADSYGPLYVARRQDPLEALRKIRAFLASSDERRTAIAVACLDRVIDNLAGYEMRVTYERRRGE
jgi:hypothetical protein